MIRTLLTTTAIAMALSIPAIAQTTTTTEPATSTEMAPAGDAMAPASDATAPAGDAMAPADDAMTTETMPADSAMGTTTRTPLDMAAGYPGGEGDAIASEVLGAPIYSSTADDAEEIGTVNDLVISADGDILAVVIGVGGFLGIGEKNVAVDFTEITYEMAVDNTMRWVLPTTADALTAAPDFVWEDPADAAMATDPAMAPATDPAMAPADPAMAPADPAMAPADPAMTPADPAAVSETPIPTDTGAMGMREGYNVIEREALTADNLTDATVIGPDGEDIAEVEDLLLDDGGQIEAMLVDFGGFLGMGQKTVAVSLDNLEFAANENGDLVVYSDFTREQLEAAPDYDEATYTADPAQRLSDM